MSTENNERWMTTAEAADYVRLSIATLEKYRALGIGPRCCCPEGTRNYRYLQSDLDAWVQGGVR